MFKTIAPWALGTLILGAIIGGVIGYKLVPINTDKTTQVDTKKNDVVTVIKEVKGKDGAVETITTIVDHTKEVNKDTDVKTIQQKKPDWHVSIAYDYSFKEMQTDYTLQVERRILGPVFIGARVDTKQTVGVVLGVEF